MNFGSHGNFVVGSKVARTPTAKESNEKQKTQYHRDNANDPKHFKLPVQEGASGNQLRSPTGVCAQDSEDNELRDYEERDKPVALPNRGGCVSNGKSAYDHDVQEDFER